MTKLNFLLLEKMVKEHHTSGYKFVVEGVVDQVTCKLCSSISGPWYLASCSRFDRIASAVDTLSFPMPRLSCFPAR